MDSHIYSTHVSLTTVALPSMLLHEPSLLSMPGMRVRGNSREAHVGAIYMRIHLAPLVYISAQWDNQGRKRNQKQKQRDENKVPMPTPSRDHMAPSIQEGVSTSVR